MVALDGSEKGRRALPVASALAAIAETGLLLVRVVAPLSSRLSNQAELLGLDPRKAPALREAGEELAEAAHSSAIRAGQAVAWEILEGGDVPMTLSRVARERHALAVVMGTRGASAAGLAIVGSVADRVMRECPIPVVLVPPGASDIKRRQIEIQRILVPLDGSPLAARSIELLLELPNTSMLEFVLVEVVRDPADVPLGERRLQGAAERFHGRAADVVPRVLIGRDPAAAIVAAVREFHADLIATSTRGEGGLRRLFLGSVAEGVVRSAEVPVLLLTPAMLEAAASGDQSHQSAPTDPVSSAP